MLRIILVLLLAAFIIIQFFRPAKNISTEASVASADISAKYNVSEEVNSILKIACNDCHSNNTIYPWYNNIQPVAWWLDSHVREGKRALNFNEFLTYRPRKQFHKMEELEKEVKENGMPLGSYTIIHRNAKLSPRQKQILIGWSKEIREKMRASYPADSLLKK